MRRIVASACLATLPFALSSPLRAQTPGHPPYMPRRDVKVVYDVEPQGAPGPQRITVWFADDGDLMRIDSPNGEGETILDRDRRLLTLVMNSDRVYMQVPERQGIRSPFLLDASMSFVRDGEGSVAGLECTRWKITANQGNAAACITTDGVVLSESGVDSQGARGQLTAQRVTYGTIPPSTFLPPIGYSRVAHPEGPAPLPPGGQPPGGQGAPTLGAPPPPGNP